jgi:hypothetical protein
VPRQPNFTLINWGFENLGTAVNLGADAFIAGRDLKFRDCDIGFEVRDGNAQFDLDRVYYDDRPPRRERGKKKRR